MVVRHNRACELWKQMPRSHPEWFRVQLELACSFEIIKLQNEGITKLYVK